MPSGHLKVIKGSGHVFAIATPCHTTESVEISWQPYYGNWQNSFPHFILFFLPSVHPLQIVSVKRVSCRYWEYQWETFCDTTPHVPDIGYGVSEQPSVILNWQEVTFTVYHLFLQKGVVSVSHLHWYAYQRELNKKCIIWMALDLINLCTCLNSNFYCSYKRGPAWRLPILSQRAPKGDTRSCVTLF